ncbi:hypothetical protein [Shewanella sp. KCT]|uniref:hypothetical protein n=1 Tax=Shewanella sp. KCT TaxID=2569535 RepID=UPI001182C113|nr:hypothetical protein [Shewanella sp. KCT]TVP09810.1 hypothetical protein AYI87_19160 [Shewanella sp. KCT]
MAISKAQWQQVEDELAGSWVNVAFSYQGVELLIRRERRNESTTVLAVYLDGVIKGAWMCQVKDLPADAPSILPKVWVIKSMARYKRKSIVDIEKIWGKRRAKKEYPDLHSRIEYLVPYFSKASVLCRQFKKLEGLELTKAQCLSEPVVS